MGDTRPVEATRDVMAALSAGINVVGSAPGGLQYHGGAMPQKAIDRVEEAARSGNSSVYITGGVDPGFATDLLPFAIASTCQRIEQIKTMEIADYATYDGGAEVMSIVMGFGNPMDQPGMLFYPGILSAAWGTAIKMLAAGLGVEVDEITESYELEPAPEDIEVATGGDRQGHGGRHALRDQRHGQRQTGDRRGAHHPGARGPAPPTGPSRPSRGGSYRVEITGEPSYVVDICPTSSRGDHNYAAILAPRAGSSTPSPRRGGRGAASGPLSTCRWGDRQGTRAALGPHTWPQWSGARSDRGNPQRSQRSVGGRVLRPGRHPGPRIHRDRARRAPVPARPGQVR